MEKIFMEKEENILMIIIEYLKENINMEKDGMEIFIIIKKNIN